MKYILLVLLLAACGKSEMKDWKWDPVKGMIRITYGQIK
jgi:hypothetical protein|tara:strand:+ start:650 stop:766 length:117 start_codon:yes stop_codon:yes gene_type:complete